MSTAVGPQNTPFIAGHRLTVCYQMPTGRLTAPQAAPVEFPPSLVAPMLILDVAAKKPVRSQQHVLNQEQNPTAILCSGESYLCSIEFP